MDELIPLLRLLADGDTHSGNRLGERLGISRAAVWKRLARLQALGVPLEARPGRGYRLAQPIDLLDGAALKAALAPATRARLAAIDLLPTVDSTNAHLARLAPWPAPRACLAEHQSAGRGRRGRPWVSPLGASLYLSLAWPFRERPAALETLALRAALAVAEALEDLGLPGVGLKWPNDLVADGRKLAGILIELQGEWGGAQQAIVGVGVNVHLPPEAARTIDRPWTDLATLMGPERPSRTALAAALLDRLCATLERLERSEDDDWRERWRARELYRGEPVRLLQEGGEIQGVYRGIAEDGALLLESDGRLRRCYAGEMSLRPAHADPETTP